MTDKTESVKGSILGTCANIVEMKKRSPNWLVNQLLPTLSYFHAEVRPWEDENPVHSEKCNAHHVYSLALPRHLLNLKILPAMHIHKNLRSTIITHLKPVFKRSTHRWWRWYRIMGNLLFARFQATGSTSAKAMTPDAFYLILRVNVKNNSIIIHLM